MADQQQLHLDHMWRGLSQLRKGLEHTEMTIRGWSQRAPSQHEIDEFCLVLRAGINAVQATSVTLAAVVQAERERADNAERARDLAWKLLMKRPPIQAVGLN